MNTATDIFKALSEPIRLRIIVLLTRGELCVCDLMEVLELPQSTVSRHMARLRQAGLVQDTRKGKWVYYRLAAPESLIVSGVLDLLDGMVKNQPHRDDLARLDAHNKTKHC